MTGPATSAALGLLVGIIGAWLLTLWSSKVLPSAQRAPSLGRSLAAVQWVATIFLGSIVALAEVVPTSGKVVALGAWLVPVAFVSVRILIRSVPAPPTRVIGRSSLPVVLAVQAVVIGTFLLACVTVLRR